PASKGLDTRKQAILENSRRCKSARICRLAPTHHSAASHSSFVREVPLVGSADAVFQADSRPPTGSLKPRNVEKLARRAIRFAGIESDAALVSNDALDQRCQFGNREILTATYVDDLVAVIAEHEVQSRIGQIVHVQELTPWGPTAPNHHLSRTAHLSLVKLSQERRQNVRCSQIEIIA